MAFKTWWRHQYMVGIICPPPGRNRVKLGAKPWCGPVPMPTGAHIKPTLVPTN